MTTRTPPTGNLETRRAEVAGSSVNVERRTAEIIFTTGARVLRANWVDGKFWEELEVSAKAVDLTRFNSGRAPLLVDHDGGSVGSVVGVIESARIQDGKGYASVRFARDAKSEEVFQKVADGVLGSISVGYRIEKMEKIEAGADSIPVFKATRWQPAEASLVSMPADPGAHVRSQQSNPNHRSNTNMKTEEQIRTEERTRNAGILHACRSAGMENLADGLIADPKITLDAARSLVIDELAKRSDAIPTENHIRMTDGGQRGDHGDFVQAAVDGLVMRAGIKVARPHAAAKDMRGMSIYEIARTALSRSGKSTGGMSNAKIIDLATRATTGDFPNILSGSLRASLRSGYETEPSSHRQFVRVQPFMDYRDLERPILGSMPGLDLVPEGAEYRNAPMPEDDATSYRVTKFGRVVNLSDEVIKNDRLDAFLRLQPALGMAARRTEADAVYNLFSEDSENGPLMQDSVRLFHSATHGNVATAGPLDAGGLGAARALLRKQTALGGGFLNLQPRVLLVGPDLETQAEVLLAQSGRVISATLEGNVPKWIGALQLAVEPRLAGTSYYVIGDASQCDHVELGILDECMNGPVFEEERDFRSDSWSYKIKHVFGVKVLDWRNMVRVPYSA